MTEPKCLYVASSDDDHDDFVPRADNHKDPSILELSDSTDNQNENPRRKRLHKRKRKSGDPVDWYDFGGSDEEKNVILKRLCTRRQQQERDEERSGDSDDDIKVPQFSQMNHSDLSDTESNGSHLKERRRAAIRKRRGGCEGLESSNNEESSSDESTIDVNMDDEASSISLDSNGCATNQLLCHWCDCPKHLDNFSARQRRNENNSTRYCLIHTAGPQRNYVERLEHGVESNLSGSDREGEAEEEIIHVDDTPKRENLQYGAWYWDADGSGNGGLNNNQQPGRQTP